MNNESVKNPLSNPDFTLAPLWFWNDLIETEPLKQQLLMMHKAGIRQPIIHARWGMLTGYLDDEWFGRFSEAIETAKQLGMKCWIYDEYGWPSGIVGFENTKKAKNREKYLYITCQKVKAGQTNFITEEYNELINVAFYTDNNKEAIIILPENLKQFFAPRGGIVYLTYVKTIPYDDGGKFAVDYLSKDAIRSFIEMTHEEYEKRYKAEFGKTLRGFFMDETRFYNPLPYTESFADTFKDIKGYDPEPYLHLLLHDGERSAQLRYDYYDMAASLYLESTFRQVYEWADARGMLTTGHFLGEETLSSQMRYNSDMMRCCQAFHIPGIDHLGNGIGSMDAKFCSSAAHNYGKSLVSCESFGASGWNFTYEDMIKHTNWLFSQGINMLVPHGMYYSIRDERKDDWPPSLFFQWQDWDKMPQYALMAARMQHLIQGSQYESDILIYYPIETMWIHQKPDFDYHCSYFKNGPAVQNQTAAQVDTSYQALLSSFQNENINFDIFNHDAAKNFTVENGKIINRLTGVSFGVFVLAYIQIIHKDIIRMLNKFTSQGGILICLKNNIQYIVDNQGEALNLESAVLADSIEQTVLEADRYIKKPFQIISGVNKLQRTQMHYPSVIYDPYLHDGENVYGIGFTRFKAKTESYFYLLVNYSDSGKDLTLKVKTTGAIEVFNPETGGILSASGVKENGYVEFSYRIAGNRCVFVKTCE